MLGMLHCERDRISLYGGPCVVPGQEVRERSRRHFDVCNTIFNFNTMGDQGTQQPSNVLVAVTDTSKEVKEGEEGRGEMEWGKEGITGKLFVFNHNF